MSQAMPPPPPPPAPTAHRGVDPWVYWVIGGLAIALIAVIIVLVIGDGDKEASDTTLGPGEAPGEVYLEPVRTLGPDPYTDYVTEAAAVSTTAPILTTTTSTTTISTTLAGVTTTVFGAGTTTTQATLAIQSLPGGQPGLYGGTLDQTRCDKAAILSFLQQNPEKAAAWVAAQNSDPTLAWDTGRTDLAVADLPAYFAELTPVTLLYDTRVTNHGFRNGLPTARQSVLQAGTAVLIDIYGVPRVRCACGNPLIPPVPTPRPPTWVGPQWPGFDPAVIIVVVPNPVIITEVIIIDLDSGNAIKRPPGGGQDILITPPTTTTTLPPTTTTLTVPPDIVVGSGDVQVTLLWAHDSDMDLHVYDPAGAHIYWNSRTSESGGQLDVDKIPSAGDLATHVENIFWPTGGAPPGLYAAYVKNYKMGSAGNGSYTMEVRVGGQLIHQESGTLADRAESTPFEFVVPGG